ncbi:cell surface protein [Methanosarcina lacustris Z-7289]|uniref:Cell surface protein n=1 Tax=Methanosarcina lacustris Z-7289 TaxID=1434111 RepID=A0A0E3S7E6_9EURY|nr:cell surface protein [Methanosarcina lacustris Z-7289]AKB74943.1 cell surface protein [Methanosarcina lacustris Z-7289]
MKINKRTAIYLGIFLVLLMMTVGNAAAVQENGTETRITTDEADQQNPAIYGDRIVWQDDRNGGNGYSWKPTGNWDIYMYDASTSTETRITTSESCQINPVIYGDKIVWQDNRNGEGWDEYGRPDGNWDIYMYDLSTKTEIHTNNTSAIPVLAINVCKRRYNIFIVRNHFIYTDFFYSRSVGKVHDYPNFDSYFHR